MAGTLDFSPFDQFDPVNDSPGIHYYDRANSILYRSRKLLGSYSRDQLSEMVEQINFMLAYPDVSIPDWDSMEEGEGTESEALNAVFYQETPPSVLGQKSGSPGDQVRSHPDHWYLSPAVVLAGRMELFDIQGQAELIDVTWSHYFAVLALALVAESKSIPGWIVDQHGDDEVFRSLHEAHFAADLLIDAMEAIGRAEQLEVKTTEASNISVAVEKRISMNTRRGGVQRHAETNRVKRDFIRFVIESYIPALRSDEKFVRSDAVKKYYAEFLEDKAPDDFGDRYRYQDNWIRMLTTAYREYEHKGKIPPLPEDDPEI